MLAPETAQRDCARNSMQSTITRRYDWTYLGSKWTLNVDIPEDLCRYYCQKSRVVNRLHDYSAYVTHWLDDALIGNLGDKIKEAAEKQGLGKWETVNLAASFVQSLPYTSARATTSHADYPRYPVETLLDNGGDCEDTSILLAAILKKMGYDVVLIVVLIGPPPHMAVGVRGEEGVNGTYWEHEGKNYLYLETTVNGQKLGESPPAYIEAKAYVYGIP